MALTHPRVTPGLAKAQSDREGSMTCTPHLGASDPPKTLRAFLKATTV